MFSYKLEVLLVLIKLYLFQGGQVLLYKQFLRSTRFGWRILHGYPNYILSKGPNWMYGRGGFKGYYIPQKCDILKIYIWSLM